MKTPFTFIIVDDVKEKNSSIDYSTFIDKVKKIIKEEGLKVTVKQGIVEE